MKNILTRIFFLLGAIALAFVAWMIAEAVQRDSVVSKGICVFVFGFVLIALDLILRVRLYGARISSLFRIEYEVFAFGFIPIWVVGLVACFGGVLVLNGQ